MVPFGAAMNPQMFSSNPLFANKDLQWEQPVGVDYFVNKKTGKISKTDPNLPAGLVGIYNPDQTTLSVAATIEASAPSRSLNLRRTVKAPAQQQGGNDAVDEEAQSARSLPMLNDDE